MGIRVKCDCSARIDRDGKGAAKVQVEKGKRGI